MAHEIGDKTAKKKELEIRNGKPEEKRDDDAE